ncbi:MerR family transcriptional regulator [Actinoplanes sp. NPDC023714]|uniref:MerR family transcriptional regulator n=1 Tax=Actinoplanes sp. NPDC023714 TaxID=3154322 RepID=UPI0033C41779
MKSQTRVYRPADLGKAHGLSAQAVRNYERDGFLPPAARSATGYRRYTDHHVGALGAYVALVQGYGYRTAGGVMRSVNAGEIPAALVLIDEAHVQLHRDRSTLASVASAVGMLTAAPPEPTDPGRGPVTVGLLAHRLGVTPATLRKWESVGILAPARDRTARVYSPSDVRDAELAHLLRRGGYPLSHIAAVVRQVRSAGGPEPLASSLAEWQQRLNERARLMLTGAARLADYLDAPSFPRS